MSDDQPTQPLTDAEIAAIRGAIERTDMFEEDTLPLAFSDRKKLLAEMDRLRAENDQMRRNVAYAAAIVSGDAAEMLPETIAKLRARVDRLIAEREADSAVFMAHRAAFDRLQSERNALVAKLGLEWGPDEFGDLAEVPDLAAARELHQPAHSAWHYEHCANGCGMDINGPDPWPCDTAEALGMTHGGT